MHEYINNRGYRALLNSSLLSGIGDSLYNIVFVVYAGSLPFKTLAVSLASMAGIIPALLEIITGYFADLSDHKLYGMVAVRLVQTTLFVLLAGLITMHPSLWLFLALLGINIVSDTIGQLANGLQLPLLKRLIPGDAMNEAMGFTSASHTTVQVIFQGVGASIIVLLSYNYSLLGLINAATFMLAAIALLRRHGLLTAAEPGHSPQHADRPPMLTSIADTLKYLAHDNFMRTTIILAAMCNFFGPAIEGLINLTLLSVPALRVWNYGSSVALFSISMSLGSALGAFFAHDPLRHVHYFPLLFIAVFVQTSTAVMMIARTNVFLIAAATFCTSYLIGKSNARFAAFFVRAIPEGMLAKVSGATSMAVMLMAPLGQLVFITVANLANVTTSWVLYAGGTAMLMIYILISIHNLHEAPI